MYVEEIAKTIHFLPINTYTFNLTGSRRSNVVKQVELLKKNREERRAKQLEIMEGKVAQKNSDPGLKYIVLNRQSL
jgi:hypothetical protein